MTPEFYPLFYTIIGTSLSLAGFTLGLFIYFHSQVSKRFDAQDARMDRLEARMDRLEAKFDRLSEEFKQLVERVHSLEIKVSRLEWMLDAAIHGRPVIFPAPPTAAQPRPPNPAPQRKTPARRRTRRSRRTGAPRQPETAS